MRRLLLAACAAPILFACSAPDDDARTAGRDQSAAQSAETIADQTRPASNPDTADARSAPSQGPDSEPAQTGDREADQSDGDPDGGASPGADDDADAAPPPQNALPDDPGTVERDYLLGPWAAKGGDCTRPDFDISPIPGGDRLSIETSLDGAPRTGEVRFGEDAAFVFDQPETVFAVEKRSPDALAVMAPQTGAIDLGGRTIEGDGRVFIGCPD